MKTLSTALMALFLCAGLVGALLGTTSVSAQDERVRESELNERQARDPEPRGAPDQEGDPSATGLFGDEPGGLFEGEGVEGDEDPSGLFGDEPGGLFEGEGVEGDEDPSGLFGDEPGGLFEEED